MGTCVVTAPPPMVLTCVTAALERQPVLFDPLKVPVAIQVCCTIVVTAPWLLTTLCENDVEVVDVVMVVYSVAVADGVQDMVPRQKNQASVTPRVMQKIEEKRKKTGPESPKKEKVSDAQTGKT